MKTVCILIGILCLYSDAMMLRPIGVNRTLHEIRLTKIAQNKKDAY